MRAFSFLALLLPTLSACGGIAVRSECTTDEQCPGQLQCVGGVCQWNDGAVLPGCDPRVESCDGLRAECDDKSAGEPFCLNDALVVCDSAVDSPRVLAVCEAECLTVGDGAQCGEARCGDGVVNQSGEACDDGNVADDDACVGCQTAICGDGAVWLYTERCDDGNTTTGDGCGDCAAVVSVGLGASHSCAVDSAGRVKCWGNGESGRLGLEDQVTRGDDPNEMGENLPPVSLGSGRKARSVALGGSHTCALLDDGAVKCWGSNAAGRLGLGDPTNRGAHPGEMGDALPAVDLGAFQGASAIVAGEAHTCVILNDASVKCWGENTDGQLGLGDTKARGDEPFEMGDALPLVALGPGRKAMALAAGSRHTCALLDDGSVKCWGANEKGQLGQGDTLARGDHPYELENWLPPVDLGPGRAIAVAAADAHSCVVLEDGAVKCWGTNDFGELGLGNTEHRGDQLFGGKLALLPVNLGSGNKASAITAGKHHTCAVLQDQRIKCWGANGKGQLGAEFFFGALGDVPEEMGNNLPRIDLGTGRRVSFITAGDLHTCALLDDDTVKCWGDNVFGQLGLGHVRSRGQGGSMGDKLKTLLLP